MENERVIYKNSECAKCDCIDDILKWKKSPLDNKWYIYCRECYKKEYREANIAKGGVNDA